MSSRVVPGRPSGRLLQPVEAYISIHKRTRAHAHTRTRAHASMATRAVFVSLLLLPLVLATAAAANCTSVVVDLGATQTPFAHYWKRSFGSGHAKLTLRPDWQASAPESSAFTPCLLRIHLHYTPHRYSSLHRPT